MSDLISNLEGIKKITRESYSNFHKDISSKVFMVSLLARIKVRFNFYSDNKMQIHPRKDWLDTVTNSRNNFFSSVAYGNINIFLLLLIFLSISMRMCWDQVDWIETIVEWEKRDGIELRIAKWNGIELKILSFNDEWNSNAVMTAEWNEILNKFTHYFASWIKRPSSLTRSDCN